MCLFFYKVLFFVLCFHNSTANITIAQNCGSFWNTFVLSQQTASNPNCSDKIMTNFEVRVNGVVIVADVGCWSDLRGKWYQLGSKIGCSFNQNSNGEYCSEILSLDSTESWGIRMEVAVWVLFLLMVFCVGSNL